MHYDVTEKKLRREFEEFGPVKRVRMVMDKNTGRFWVRAGFAGQPKQVCTRHPVGLLGWVRKATDSCRRRMHVAPDCYDNVPHQFNLSTLSCLHR